MAKKERNSVGEGDHEMVSLLARYLRILFMFGSLLKFLLFLMKNATESNE